MKEMLLEPEDFGNQQERLTEDHGYNEYEAEELHRNIQTYVMLYAKESDIDYSEDAIGAMTNMAVAIHIRDKRENTINQTDQRIEIVTRVGGLLVLFGSILALIEILAVGTGWIPILAAITLLVLALRFNIVRPGL